MSSIRLIKRAAPALLFLLAALGGSRAAAGVRVGAAAQSGDLAAPIRPGSKTTYFDLLRELFPDLRADATAGRTIPLRSLSEPFERRPIEGGIKFDFKPRWIMSEGRRLLLLWVDLTAARANEGMPYEGEAVVLAVYGLEPRVTLLDALEVKNDRFTGFWGDRPVFRLSPTSDALVVYSTHSNAGESYVSIDVLFVDAGRFKKIASRFVYNTQGCGAGFTQTPHFRAVADPGRKYPRVLLKVRLRREPDGPECERRAAGYTRFYSGLYRWNPARGRYEGGSRQLDTLDEFNERRVSSP
ncbi:MAG TPA: hypothetical protein VM914_04785 [Pyrinomonadaceae bacterium]|nr:hypothetical protein [Pyrinomonadaceae bacterium]